MAMNADTSMIVWECLIAAWNELGVSRIDVNKSPEEYNLIKLRVWGMCLASFAEKIRGKGYNRYRHKTVYTDDTYKMKFRKIPPYLAEKVKETYKE